MELSFPFHAGDRDQEALIELSAIHADEVDLLGRVRARHIAARR
jgi:hypothetical protein